MRYWLCILFLFAALQTQAFHYVADSTSINTILKQLKIRPVASSNPKTEIIIQLGESFSTQGKVLHLQEINNNWSGTLYTYFIDAKYAHTIDKYETKVLVPESDWKQVLQELEELNVYSLPSQSTLEPKMKKESDVSRNGQKGYLKVMVTDGSAYNVIVKSENHVRSYAFYSPWIYSSHYPDVKELKNYSAIINTLEREFGISFR